VRKFENPTRQKNESLRASKATIQCVHVDSKETDSGTSSRIAKQFGVTGGSELKIRMLKKAIGMHSTNPGKWPKFKPEPEEISKVDKKLIEKFLKDVNDGEAKAYFMSEALPEDWDKNPVTVRARSPTMLLKHA